MNIPNETIQKAREVMEEMDAVGLQASIEQSYEAEIRIIASALHSARMEERERCAKVADESAKRATDFIDKHGSSRDFDMYANGCRNVATAIRSTKAD